MNSRQRLMLWSGVGAFSLVGIFPPWVWLDGMREHAFIGLPPVGSEIDAGRLMIQWGVIAVLTVTALYGLRTNPRERAPRRPWMRLWRREWPLVLACALAGFALVLAFNAAGKGCGMICAGFPYLLLQTERLALRGVGRLRKHVRPAPEKSYISTGLSHHPMISARGVTSMASLPGISGARRLQ